MWLDYILTTVFGVCSTVLIGIDFWILMVASQGLIDSSNCSTAPLNTFFTGAFVSLVLCMTALLLIVYESKRNTQSYPIHSFIALIWTNAFIWAILGAIWTNQSSNERYCNSTSSYRTMVVLFINFSYLFIVQVFITVLALLGIGAVFEHTQPMITSLTNTIVGQNGQTIDNGIDMDTIVVETGINDIANPDIHITHHT